MTTKRPFEEHPFEHYHQEVDSIVENCTGLKGIDENGITVSAINISKRSREITAVMKAVNFVVGNTQELQQGVIIEALRADLRDYVLATLIIVPAFCPKDQVKNWKPAPSEINAILTSHNINLTPQLAEQLAEQLIERIMTATKKFFQQSVAVVYEEDEDDDGYTAVRSVTNSEELRQLLQPGSDEEELTRMMSALPSKPEEDERTVVRALPQNSIENSGVLGNFQSLTTLDEDPLTVAIRPKRPGSDSGVRPTSPVNDGAEERENNERDASSIHTRNPNGTLTAYKR